MPGVRVSPRGTVVVQHRRCYRNKDVDMTVFCIAEHEHAERFRERFGGEFLEPATRPRWPGTRTRHTDLSAEQRLRNGRCINCDD